MAMITNPAGVQGHDTPQIYQLAQPFRASGAITKGDLVTFVYVEADRELQVKATDTDTDDPALTAGVAHFSGAADDEMVMVVVQGYAEVNIGSGSVAAGERVIGTATPGEADGVAADGTTVEGDTAGVFLGDEIGTSNTAPCWID